MAHLLFQLGWGAEGAALSALSARRRRSGAQAWHRPRPLPAEEAGWMLVEGRRRALHLLVLAEGGALVGVRDAWQYDIPELWEGGLVYRKCVACVTVRYALMLQHLVTLV